MSSGAYTACSLPCGGTAIEENGVRSFLFTGTKRALLVDTGFGTGDLPSLVAGLAGLPLTVVNTHADRDHIGCNAAFARVHMHPAEYDRYAAAGGNMAAVRPLWEGENIDLGGRSFEAVLIPGHTPGSLALLDRKNRLLVSGDSVQDGSIFMFGPGRSLPGLVHSLQKLEGMLAAFDTIYPSHANLPLPASFLPGLLADTQAALAGDLPCSVVEVHGQEVGLASGKQAGFLLPLPE